MKERQCKDCLQMSDTVNKSGLCRQCRIRKANFKSRGGKYVPIKDLSEYEQQKVFNRRNKNKDNTPRLKTGNPVIRKSITDFDEGTQTLINKVAQGNEELYKQILTLLNINEETVRESVRSDIEKEMQRRKINIGQDKYLPIEQAIEVLYDLTNIENSSDDYMQAYQMFNELVRDYEHMNENTSLENLKDFIENSIKTNEALKCRRPVKNKVVLFNECNELIDYIKQDKKFLQLLSDTRIKLKDCKDCQENPVYVSRASDSILSKKNVLPKKKGIRQRYDVWVPCVGLYGNYSEQEFRLHNGTIAESPEQAKQALRSAISKLKNVTYREKDIQVALWNDKKEGA